MEDKRIVDLFWRRDESAIHETKEKFNGYLRTVSTENRVLFVRRYYYCDSVQELARRSGYSKAKVKTVLFRMRGELKDYLGKEGFIL